MALDVVTFTRGVQLADDERLHDLNEAHFGPGGRSELIVTVCGIRTPGVGARLWGWTEVEKAPPACRDCHYLPPFWAD